MTKRAIITRGQSTDQGTFGVLSFGDSTMRTLELPWRDNKRARSCIPAGEYQCRLWNSPKFGRVYQVYGIKGRDLVLIHPANFAGDVERGWATHLHGCIAPCYRVGSIRNPSGVMQRAGLVSRPAVREFMSWAKGEPFILDIRDA